MREIKFRAWDKKDKVMRTVYGINYPEWHKDKHIRLETELQLFCSEPNYDLSSFTRPLKDCELMESTGLKDKNGVEIYEGDILRHQHHKNSAVVMEWLVDGWKVKVSTPKGPRWHEFWEGRSDDYGKEKNGWYEVIGNVMENKELLK